VNITDDLGAAATINVGGDLTATFNVSDNINAGATLIVGGDISGTVNVGNAIHGDITTTRLSGSIEAVGQITGTIHVTAGVSTSPAAHIVSDGETFEVEITDVQSQAADPGVTIDFSFTDTIAGPGGGRWYDIALTGADADNLVTFTGGDVTGTFNVPGAGLGAGLWGIELTAGNIDAVITSDSLRVIMVDSDGGYANTANLDAVNHLLAYFVRDANDAANLVDFDVILADGPGGIFQTQPLTFTNMGVGDGDITVANTGTADFVISDGLPQTVAPGAALVFDVTFDPQLGSVGVLNDIAAVTMNEDLDGVTMGGALTQRGTSLQGVAVTPMPNRFAFTDADGSTVRVRLAGGGTIGMALQGGAANNADIDCLRVFNSTNRTILTTNSFGGGDGGVTPIDYVGSDGAIRRFNLDGNINEMVDVGGGAANLFARDVANDAEIYVLGNLNTARFRQIGTNVAVFINGRVNTWLCREIGLGSYFEIDGYARMMKSTHGGWGADVSLDGGGLGTLSGRTWVTSDILTTHAVRSVKALNGDFDGSVIAQNTDGDRFAIGTLKAFGGDVDLVVAATGNVRNIQATVRDGAGGDVSGDYTGDTFNFIKAGDTLTADMEATQVNRLIADTIDNSHVEVTGMLRNLRTDWVNESVFSGGIIRHAFVRFDATDTGFLGGYDADTDTPQAGYVGTVRIGGDAHDVDIVSQVGTNGDGFFGDGNDAALGLVGPNLGTIRSIRVGGNVTGTPGETFGFLADNGTFRVFADNAPGGWILANGAPQFLDGNVMVDVL